MKIPAFLLSLAALIVLPASLWAQSESVTLRGTVRDSVQTLPYVSVYLKKHSEKGMQTDKQGQFSLSISRDKLPDTLVVSCIGYRVFYKPIPKETENLDLDIQLHRSTVVLDNIMVMGVSKMGLQRAEAKARHQAEILERRQAIRELNFKFQAQEVFLPKWGWRALSPGLNFMLFNDGFMVYSESLFRTYFQPSINNGFSGHDDPPFMVAGQAEISYGVNERGEVEIQGQSLSQRFYEEFTILADPASNFCTLEFPNIHEPQSLKKYFDAGDGKVLSFTSLKYRGYIIPLVEKIDPKLLMEGAVKEQKGKEKARDDRRAKRGK